MADIDTVLTDDTKSTDTKADDVKKTVITDDVKSVDDKKTDDKAATKDDTKDDATKQSEVIPEKYNLKLPKNSPLNEADLESTADMAKALGMTQEKAQKLLEARSADRQAVLDGQKEFLQNQVAEWETATTKDPEIAGKDGSEFKQNVAYAKQVLSKYGSPQLIKALNQTGLGNHPELVRIMVRIGKAMKEDSFESGKETKGSETGDPVADAAAKLYGKGK